MEKGNEADSRRFLPGQNIRICDGDGGEDGAILRTRRAEKILTSYYLTLLHCAGYITRAFHDS